MYIYACGLRYCWCCCKWFHLADLCPPVWRDPGRVCPSPRRDPRRDPPVGGAVYRDGRGFRSRRIFKGTQYSIYTSGTVCTYMCDRVHISVVLLYMYDCLCVCVCVCLCVCLCVQASCFTVSGENLTARLRSLSFGAMLRQEIGWHDDEKNSTGTLTTRLSHDASQVQGVSPVQ